MDTPERPFDSRIRGIRGEMQQVEQDLHKAGEYLADLPEQERAKAVAAMKNVFEAGMALGQHQHTSPMKISDQPLLGPELRAHLREAEVVQTEMHQLRNIAQQIFRQRTDRYMRTQNAFKQAA